MAPSRTLCTPRLYFEDFPILLQFGQEHGVSKRVIRRWKRRYLKDALTRICLGDKVNRGYIDPLVFRGLFKDYRRFPYLWLVTLPALFLPSSVLHMLRRHFSYNRKMA